jgi:hypothetical protein
MPWNLARAFLAALTGFLALLALLAAQGLTCSPRIDP